MSNFEFVFSLFGLMLGLSMAEVMSGLSRTLKAYKRVRIGWLTPLLGLLLIVDLLSFWVGAWDNRDAIPVTFTSMLYGAGVACIYYLAASLVFPRAARGVERPRRVFLHPQAAGDRRGAGRQFGEGVGDRAALGHRDVASPDLLDLVRTADRELGRRDSGTGAACEHHIAPLDAGAFPDRSRLAGPSRLSARHRAAAVAPACSRGGTGAG
jgi:hypothetical protein